MFHRYDLEEDSFFPQLKMLGEIFYELVGSKVPSQDTQQIELRWNDIHYKGQLDKLQISGIGHLKLHHNTVSYEGNFTETMPNGEGIVTWYEYFVRIG